MGEEIRHAASVVAVREGTGDPEVLVLERGPASRFLPGYVVFPGGAVDDADTALAARWFDDEGEAARAAAVRELVEEAGLALTRAGLVDAGEPDSLDPVHAAPPSVSQLHELARWIAPDDVPVRFDARYFAIAAEPGLEPAPDGSEAAHAWWASPKELLAEWQVGARRLYWPTYATMIELAACESAKAIASLTFVTREPDDDEVVRLPRSVFWEE
ncbi:MAG: NUDIX domain-containing protein [Actinomycetota bacterium]|nr:NUDIX domain-containing protein [Actinomycetota bacterium]